MYEFDCIEMAFGFSVLYSSGRKKTVSGFDSYYSAVCAAEKFLCKKNVVSCSVGYQRNGIWSFAD